MTPTEEMIAQLNAAEEVLAALDQAMGGSNELGRAFSVAYEWIERARKMTAEDWNSMIEPDDSDLPIYRCSEASKHYHTDADGPCDVWSTDQVCGLHVQLAEEQMAARESLRECGQRSKA